MSGIIDKFGDSIRNLQTDENAPASDLELIYNLFGGDKTFGDDSKSSNKDTENSSSKKEEKEKFGKRKRETTGSALSKGGILRDLKVSAIIVAMIMILRSDKITSLITKVSPKPMMSKLIFYSILIILTFLIMRVVK